MAHYTFQADRTKWTARKGLEGPFFYANGRVLYYDPREGAYWDPQTDFYVEADELHVLHDQFLTLLKGNAT